MRVAVDGRFNKFVRPEGARYGCWFWPMPGSGIFVNVGRTLVFESRRAAAAEFDRIFGFGKHDNSFAHSARLLGFDSLQILSGSLEMYNVRTAPFFELVLAYDGCFDDKYVVGPCPPVPLRTGARAGLPCECADHAAPIINCRSHCVVNCRPHRNRTSGTRAAKAPWGQSAMARIQGRTV